MTPNEAFAVFDASMRAQGLTDVPAWHRKEECQAAHAVAEAAVTAERAARLEAERALKDLKWRVAANAGSRAIERKRLWAHVHDVTAFGSGKSAELCREAGFDPDEMVGGET